MARESAPALIPTGDWCGSVPQPDDEKPDASSSFVTAGWLFPTVQGLALRGTLYPFTLAFQWVTLLISFRVRLTVPIQTAITRLGEVSRLTELPRTTSAHWLRHTSGSHMMDRQVDLRYVRDNLGHESISTTSQYLHADDDDRHRATESGLRLDW
jgi:integrase